MKRIVYTFCTAVCVLFTAVSCSRSNDSGVDDLGGGITNNNFSNEVTRVAPLDLIQKMADGGATIYGGTNPPIVQPLLPGLLFTTGELELIHTSLGNNDPLKNFDGFYYRFYGQNGSKLKIDYENHVVATYAAQGDLVALSGEFTGDAIKDFQLTSLVKVADNNSPKGTVRVFKSKKGYAETVRR